MVNDETGLQLPNTERNRAIIDEYYCNGFNGSKAVRTITGSDQNAKQQFQAIIKHDSNKAYIIAKKQELSRKADIKQLQIIKELINFAYNDSTEFINLSPDEIKNLPSDIKRTIQSFEHKKHSYIDRNEIAHTEEIIRIKFVDKLKAIDMINKHIGLYESDNRQKANNIQLNKFDNVTLNALYQAITTQNDDDITIK